jgi:hypothetical protein
LWPGQYTPRSSKRWRSAADCFKSASRADNRRDQSSGVNANSKAANSLGSFVNIRPRIPHYESQRSETWKQSRTFPSRPGPLAPVAQNCYS